MERRLALAGLIGIGPVALLLTGVIYFPVATALVMLAIMIFVIAMAIGVIVLDIYDAWRDL